MLKATNSILQIRKLIFVEVMQFATSQWKYGIEPEFRILILTQVTQLQIQDP